MTQDSHPLLKDANLGHRHPVPPSHKRESPIIPQTPLAHLQTLPTVASVRVHRCAMFPPPSPLRYSRKPLQKSFSGETQFMIPRRKFLKAAAASSALFAIHPRLFSQAATQASSHIEILLDEPVGPIAREIYGHFTEHMGAVIYDGVYVGED